MRNGTIANNSGQVLARVEYPARYAFAFNPLLITVGEETIGSLQKAYIRAVKRYGGSDDYYRDEADFTDGEAVFDISMFCRGLFDLGNIEDNTERIITVQFAVGVTDKSGTNHEMHSGEISGPSVMNVIWGAIAPTEEYNGLTMFRWFSRFPMKLEFFAQAGAKVYKEIDGKGTHTLVSTVSDMGIASIDLSGAFEGDTVVKKAARYKSGEGFVYDNVKFNSASDELTRCDFLDYVKGDNKVHFTSLPNFDFYASSVQDLADRIQANLDRIYTGSQQWTVVVSSTARGKRMCR